MSRKDRPLPYFVDRLSYWLLDIAYPLSSPPAWAPTQMPLAQAAQEDTRDNAYAIFDGRDSPMHPEHCPDLRLELDYMNLSTEPDRCVRALRYWIMRNRLWYADPEAQALRRTLPAVKQQALLAFSQQRWAPPSSPWTWETLLQRIAQDQVIFRDIITIGSTDAGVAPTSAPEVAPQRYGMSKTVAHKIYVAYRRQASILLGRGMLPPKTWAEAMRDEGLLNKHGRIHALPFGSSATVDPFLLSVRIDMPHLSDWEAVYHWFAHALRNLCRYQNGHHPLPWPDNHTSCHDHCERELRKLLPHCDPPPHSLSYC